MKIGIVQINPTIGDFEGNYKKIVDGISWGKSEGADLVVFPEKCVTGYPPKDLLEQPSFIESNLKCVEAIAKHCTDIAAIIGFASVNESAVGKGLFNSAALLNKGKVEFVQHKALLPTYDVFDEGRYFEAVMVHKVVSFKGVKLGITICEDVWSTVTYGGRRLYHYDPVEKLVKDGAQVLINISASPFYAGKDKVREGLLTQTASKHGVPIVYVNTVGANDELVFDGRSIVVDGKGNIVTKGLPFEEDRFIVDTESLHGVKRYEPPSEVEEIYKALLLGLKDYARKCRFKKAVIGLSGGVDSALVAAIAVDALGKENVTGVAMPSPYSSKSSIEDARQLAKNLDIQFEVVPISDVYESYLNTLSSDKKNITVVEENIQARIRGNILMAISNRTGALVLSTGNKSELAVGYCTLYGDMAGGLAIISDVPKTYVYKLCEYINRKKILIPVSTIKKAPSAELRPDQKDTDSLPPYDTLDEILRLYIEERMSDESIVAKGFDKNTVEKVLKLVSNNEYKRRQAAPGLKVTSKAFGMGRRYPIAYYFTVI